MTTLMRRNTYTWRDTPTEIIPEVVPPTVGRHIPLVNKSALTAIGIDLSQDKWEGLQLWIQDVLIPNLDDVTDVEFVFRESGWMPSGLDPSASLGFRWTTKSTRRVRGMALRAAVSAFDYSTYPHEPTTFLDFYDAAFPRIAGPIGFLSEILEHGREREWQSKHIDPYYANAVVLIK